MSGVLPRGQDWQREAQMVSWLIRFLDPPPQVLEREALTPMTTSPSMPTISPSSERVQRKLFPMVKLANLHPLRPRTARAPGGIGMQYLRIADAEEKRGPVPLVIGVTGHRDLHPEQVATLEERVARVFAEVRSECRFTPLLLLTALAEGADQLAARVAVREKVPLVVVLPMEREEYERDFETPVALDEFRLLMRQAEVVHYAFGKEDPYGAGAYSNAGAYIVANCDLLVALWDGHDDRNKPGGTANVVRWQQHGLPPDYTRTRGPLDPAGSGPVRHIRVRRAEAAPACVDEWLLEPGMPDREVPSTCAPSGPDLDGEIKRSPWLGDLDWPVREQIHGFNRDAVALHDRLTDVESDALRELKEGYPGPIPDAAQRTERTLARCDALATFFGRARMRAIWSTFGWAAAAILLFTTFAHPLHHWLFLLLGYLVCFVVALWSAHRVRTLRLEEKHLDYRALAEGLRVQLYWELAGIRKSVTEYYLRNQRTELAWIPRAIRALCVWWGLPARAAEASSAKALEAVENAWVVSELKFFSPRIERMHDRLHRLEWVSTLLFKVALVGAAVLFVGLVSQNHALVWHVEHGKSVPAWFEWTIAALAILAIAAGFCRAFAEKMGYAAQIRRYEWMAGLHDRVKRAFDEPTFDDPERMREMLVDLGRYALIENAEWLRIHREHPLEVPVGG